MAETLLEDYSVDALKKQLFGKRLQDETETSKRTIIDVYLEDGVLYIDTQYEEGIQVRVPLFESLGRFTIIE